MKKINFNSGFTLLEIIISLTILSIIIVSVTSIFVVSSNVNTKVDINRSIQENIKSITENISEDVRVNGIKFCNAVSAFDCHEIATSSNYSVGNKLYTNSGIYSLKTYNNISDLWIEASECNSPEKNCVLFKGNDRVSNSWIQFYNLDFYVSKKSEAKVTINFEVTPGLKKGLSSKHIDANRIFFQTTFSERMYKDY